MSETRRTLKPPVERPNLDALIKEAIERFNALTPEQQEAHRRAQRKSWVIGNMLLDHPEMTREYVERIYDSLGM